MGASLCTLRSCCISKLPEDGDNEYTYTDFGDSTIESYVHKCDVKDARPTLEQWISSSPFANHFSTPIVISPNRSMDTSRVFRQPAKVSPVTCERFYSTPRESFSADWSFSESVVSTSSRKSLSGKRVSFKLPEEADIHRYYCDEAEDQEQVA